LEFVKYSEFHLLGSNKGQILPYYAVLAVAWPEIGGWGEVREVQPRSRSIHGYMYLPERARRGNCKRRKSEAAIAEGKKC